ncbi:MAG: Na+/H+ antiporter [Gemmatimonadales bacterium]
MATETRLILLFSIAAGVAIVVRQRRLPYTVALVLAGLGLGILHLFAPPPLTKRLVFSLFLPGLLFEAAFHIDARELWRNRYAIASLAVPGVAAAVVLTTIVLTRVVDTFDLATAFDWRHALVFGALIAATDPIAVVAVVRRLGAPRRLAVLLDGESLLNDGTAIVLFTLSLSLAAGAAAPAGALGLEFLTIVGFGGLIGLVVGWGISQVIRQIDDPMIEITLTTIAAYGAFAAAEHFHYSGVIAVVVAGVVCGSYGARTGMSPSTRIAVHSFWEYVTFALNSIVFLLIGFELEIDLLLRSWQAILAAYLIVTVARALVIGLVTALLRGTRERIPWPWSAALVWGGLRGALPMVLVLSLPADFAHRRLLVAMTFGVVLMSLVVNGTTVPAVMRRLGIAAGRRDADYDLARGRLEAATAALEALDRLATAHFADEAVCRQLQAGYERRIAEERERIRELDRDRGGVIEGERRWARRHLLLAEKNRVIDAYREGVVSQATYEQLLRDVDARLLDAESAAG